MPAKKIKSDIEAENAQLTLDGTPKKVPDIGFRVLRVDDSNYEDRRKLVDEYSPEGHRRRRGLTKMDRSDLDLLFEALPKSSCHTARRSTSCREASSTATPCTA